MRKYGSNLKHSMTQLHFIRFTEAASAYSNILSIIAEEIKTLPADLQRYDFTYMTVFTISQTLKYHKVHEDTCPRPLLLPRRLQAPTSEDENFGYDLQALQPNQQPHQSVRMWRIQFEKMYQQTN